MGHGANGANEDDLRAVAEIFREKGVENLIVTLGGNGSVAVNDKGVARVQSVKMPAVLLPPRHGGGARLLRPA